MFRTLPDHLDSCVQSHLLLTMKRVQEQQSVIVKLNQRVNHLEAQDQKHTAAVAAATASVAAAAIALEASERRAIKSIHDEIGKVDQKSVRRTSDLSSSVQSELNKLQRSFQELGREMKARK